MCKIAVLFSGLPAFIPHNLGPDELLHLAYNVVDSSRSRTHRSNAMISDYT